MAQSSTQRASIKGLSRALQISLPTVRKYLRMPGAPTAPADGLYSVAKVAEWIKRKQSGDYSPVFITKEEKAKVDLELARIELDKARRSVIAVSEIAKTLFPLISELDAIMEQEIEHTMPPKLRGKTVPEMQQMMAEARGRIIKRFREGANPILPANE